MQTQRHPPIGPAAWHTADGEDAALRSWLATYWPAVFADRVIKKDLLTQVAAAGGWIVKEYRNPAGLIGWLAGRLRSRAENAFLTAKTLASAGVSVAQPVAWTAVRARGSIAREYLITREIPQAQPLMNWLSRNDVTAEQRRSILDQLGLLIGSFHAAGFSNRDMKDTNILVTESNGQLRLMSVDLDGCRRMAPATERRLLRDFWPIRHSLALYGWDTEANMARLLAAYRERTGHGILPGQLPGAVVPDLPWPPDWTQVRRIIRRSGCARRTLSVSYPREQPEWEPLALQYWQGRLEPLERVPSSPHARVDFWTQPGTGRTYCIKRFGLRSASDAVKHAVRSSRGRRALRGQALAAARGLGVPPAVCLIEAREFGYTFASVLVTEKVANAVPLNQLLERTGRPGTRNDGDIPRLVEELGGEVGRWHAAGLVHGDLRHGNVLCRQAAGATRFVMIDNERTRRNTGLHERARNLVQLNMCPPALLSLRDRLRFWRAYCRTAPGDRPYKHRLKREVLAWTRKRWRRKGWLRGGPGT